MRISPVASATTSSISARAPSSSPIDTNSSANANLVSSGSSPLVSGAAVSASLAVEGSKSSDNEPISNSSIPESCKGSDNLEGSTGMVLVAENSGVDGPVGMSRLKPSIGSDTSGSSGVASIGVGPDISKSSASSPDEEGASILSVCSPKETGAGAADIVPPVTSLIALAGWSSKEKSRSKSRSTPLPWANSGCALCGTVLAP